MMPGKTTTTGFNEIKSSDMNITKKTTQNENDDEE